MKIADAFIDSADIEAAVASACGRIAPAWPLDRLIAVNPYWGWLDHDFDQTARALQRLAGSPMRMPRAFYLAAWKRGEFAREHLLRALSDYACTRSPEDVVEALALSVAPETALPLPSDSVDARRDLRHAPAWSVTITHQVSQVCAAYFDAGQADWHPRAGATLYTSWRTALIADRGLRLLMDAPGLAGRAERLPEDGAAAISFALSELRVPAGQRADFLTATLMRIGGWAAWCAFLRWEARLAGGDDAHIVELLAIRLSWEWLVHAGDAWQQAWNVAQESDAAPLSGNAMDRLPAKARDAVSADARPVAVEAIAQRAWELAYAQGVANALTRPRAMRATAPLPTAQAVFCIDVRSEVFRRALEEAAPAIRTLGFAGFFGLPIAYAPLGTTARRPQLPGLLAPALNAVEAFASPEQGEAVAARRRAALSLSAARRPFLRMPGSAFTLVEALGLGYVARLLRRSLPAQAPATPVEHHGLRAEDAAQVQMRLDLPGDARARAGLAAKVLGAMGLTEGLARLVLLAGHGSRSANNAHAAALNCGACGGQTGEVNARALAALLNDGAVREALAQEGIAITAGTWFIAGQHDTTTDEVELFETQRVPVSHAEDLRALRAALAAAGALTRAQRAPTLGLTHLARDPEALAAALRRRANDWAQTRPEWGLAGNAAFIVAPRERTRGIDLAGRSFLHDYDWRRDRDGQLLESIMTAPMVVTNWINLQYYGSMVDNAHYGSGNKLLHNVVGARIGVFEGNGGDLRIGLPMQSLHDGERWMHAPLRLSVFIEAPRAAIERVIGAHEVVRKLVGNGWLHLYRVDDSGCIEPISPPPGRAECAFH